MATEPLQAIYAAGNTVYFAFWDASDNVFDFSGNTWRALGAATTPSLATTESTAEGGAANSAYNASINLALLNATGGQKRVRVAAYRQLAGSPAPATDTWLTQAEITIQAAQLAIAGSNIIRARVLPCLTSTAGTAARVFAWLETLAGEKLNLSSGATCSITVTEHGSGSALFTLTDGSAGPAASGMFELTQSTPNFTPDRAYRWEVTIVENGYTHTAVEVIPAWS